MSGHSGDFAAGAAPLGVSRGRGCHMPSSWPAGPGSGRGLIPQITQPLCLACFAPPSSYGQVSAFPHLTESHAAPMCARLWDPDGWHGAHHLTVEKQQNKLK